jgi:hypothetical protein
LGAVVSPQTVYALGAEWYATRLNHDWERANKARTAAMFTRHGLVGNFWSFD